MATADSKTPTYGLTADQVDQVMADASISRATHEVIMFAMEADDFIDRYSDMKEHLPESVREELDAPAHQFPLRSLLTAMADASMRSQRIFDTVGSGAVRLRLDVDVRESPSAIEESNGTQGREVGDSSSTS